MQLTRTKSEKTKQTMDEKLNSLRAGVLGSNDGILTVVGCCLVWRPPRLISSRFLLLDYLIY